MKYSIVIKKEGVAVVVDVRVVIPRQAILKIKPREFWLENVAPHLIYHSITRSHLPHGLDDKTSMKHALDMLAGGVKYKLLFPVSQPVNSCLKTPSR